MDEAEKHYEELSEQLDETPEHDKLFIFWQLCAWYRGRLIDERDGIDTDTVAGLRSAYVAGKEIRMLDMIEQELATEIF